MKQLEESGQRLFFGLAWAYLHSRETVSLLQEDGAPEELLSAGLEIQKHQFENIAKTCSENGITYAWVTQGRGNYTGMEIRDAETGNEIGQIDLMADGHPWNCIRSMSKTPYQMLRDVARQSGQNPFEQTDYEPPAS